MAISYMNEKSDRKYFQEKYSNLRNEASKFEKIPSIDRKSEKFVDLFVNGLGSHHSMLTGKALKEYEDAVKGTKYTEINEDIEIDTSLQDLKVMQITTTINRDKEPESKILYKVSYKGLIDNEDAGIVDQRILLFLMHIKWEKVEGEYKVSEYDYDTLEDNIWSVLEGHDKGVEDK